ncbi:MAG TPA: CGNR zinc finger domain-containing protein [Plantibacter sp.]|uniref:CGNR zinc finger domain-containing protein n=1 Tax=unclassified Plantibacter TaxID=2624265 RepID=UPI002CC6A411|nr:CGNR zinc finger domain-containing protein [Plantibacter sp.]
MPITTHFRSDGGATWLNLLATQGQSFGPRPVERLPTPSAAEEWLNHFGLPLSEAVSESGLGELVQLREALRELAMATVADREPSAEATTIVEAVAGNPAAPSFPSMLGDRSLSLQAALAAIAIQALVALAGPDRQYLTSCAEEDCRWVFLDTSGRRHWCPSPACASRGRVRAHRARRATAERATADEPPAIERGREV